MTPKGIDDLLAAGGKPRRLKGAEVETYFAGLRAHFFPAPPEATAGSPDTGKGPGPPRPPFPVDVFPGPVANFASRVSAAMGCPVDFPGLGILVVAGAAIGAARSVEVKT